MLWTDAIMVLYFVFRFAGWICPLIPVQLGYWLFERIGDVAFIFARRTRQAYVSNLRRVLGKEESKVHTRRVARRAFENLFCNYFDLFRAHSLAPDQLQAQLAETHGLEYLLNAEKQGKGVVLGSAHFGNWDMILHVAAIFLHVPAVILYEPQQPEKLSAYVHLGLRRRPGVTMVAVDTGLRGVIKAVRSGHVIGMAFDRDATQSGRIVDFFGESARLPDGPVELSLKYRCPVIFAFAIRQPDHRTEFRIEPPLEFRSTGDRERDVTAGVQEMARVMERYIRQYPDQWLLFQRVWNS